MEPRIVRSVATSDLLELRFIEVAPRTVVRAVYAAADIPADTLVESCPVVPLYVDEKPGPTVAIGNYMFTWHVYDDEGNKVVNRALAMGLGGIYNHSVTPNLRKVHYSSEFILEFFAGRDITAGEELTHDCGWGDKHGGTRKHGNKLNPVDRFMRPIPNRRIPELVEAGTLDPALLEAEGVAP